MLANMYWLTALKSSFRLEFESWIVLTRFGIWHVRGDWSLRSSSCWVWPLPVWQIYGLSIAFYTFRLEFCVLSFKACSVVLLLMLLSPICCYGLWRRLVFGLVDLQRWSRVECPRSWVRIPLQFLVVETPALWMIIYSFILLLVCPSCHAR